MENAPHALLSHKEPKSRNNKWNIRYGFYIKTCFSISVLVYYYRTKNYVNFYKVEKGKRNATIVSQVNIIFCFSEKFCTLYV